MVGPWGWGWLCGSPTDGRCVPTEVLWVTVLMGSRCSDPGGEVGIADLPLTASEELLH